MIEDTRLDRAIALLDDARCEIADIEEDGHLPIRERTHLSAAHSAINTAIMRIQYTEGRCQVCLGAEKVMQAVGTPWSGFNWIEGELIPCPACNVIEVG